MNFIKKNFAGLDQGKYPVNRSIYSFEDDSAYYIKFITLNSKP